MSEQSPAQLQEQLPEQEPVKQEQTISNTKKSEDSNSLNSTNISLSETLIQDINSYKNKNIYLITKSLEPKISGILTYLLNNTNTALNKTIIIEYLQTSFQKIDTNCPIFMRGTSNDKEKLNLFQVIINQYITHFNNTDSKNDEDIYRKELLALFDKLLKNVNITREDYHYILSYLINFINNKNSNNVAYVAPPPPTDNITTNTTPNDMEEFQETDEFILKSEHLSRILILLQHFYQIIEENKTSLNYFFFSGESDSSIIIKNKIISKDNKKLLNLDDNLCILMFIKVFPSEYTKAVFSKASFKLVDLKLTDKNKDVSIGLDLDHNIVTNFSIDPLGKLDENETNWLLIKFKKKKKLKTKIYLNGIKLTKLLKKSKEKDKDKDKDELLEIVLFKNFIGICYNIIIFKTKKKKEILPKFLETEFNKIKNIKNSNQNLDSTETKIKIIPKVNNSLYRNGIYNEQLFFPFIKSELKEEIDSSLINCYNVTYSLSDIKDFLEKLIAIYIPTRVIVPKNNYDKTILDSQKLILKDSINNLDAEFNIRSPTLNGVHIYSRIIDDFKIIGGINNLIPIIEFMAKYKEFLSSDNLENYFQILLFVFSPQYQKALINEKNSNFFLNLSYFLAKIPNEYYDNRIIDLFKNISSFLMQANENVNFSELESQFHNNILMNEEILFKFNYEGQKKIFEIIASEFQTINQTQIKRKIDMTKIIKILYKLDSEKNKIFCCKNHSEYFNQETKIMNPELSVRLKPIENLINLLFQQFEKEVKNKEDSVTESGKNLYKLFTLLAFDISPCLQKCILLIFLKYLEKHTDKSLEILDQDEQILNITLFVYQNSFFDVKVYALKLIFIILENKIKNKGNISQLLDDSKCTFITNNILPFYLLEDDEIIKIANEENQEKNILSKSVIDSSNIDKKEEENIDNKPDKIEENKEINTLNIEEETKRENNSAVINNYFDKISDVGDEKMMMRRTTDNLNDIHQDIFDVMYGDPETEKHKNIKKYIDIDNVRYSLPLMNPNKIKIHSIFNKIKLKKLIIELFDMIYNYFHKGFCPKLTLDLLTKLASKGDILLISDFLEKIINERSVKEENEITKNIITEININQNFLHWLIDTCFQSILIQNSKFDHTIFRPGFNINNVIKNIKEDETQISEEERNQKISYIIKEGKELLKKIFNTNVYKMDFLFTWSKYFYELRNETNNFQSVRELVLDFMIDIGYHISKEITNPDIANNMQQKMTVYFFNLFFEFVTFYKLKLEDIEKYQKNSSLYEELSNNLKHILITKMDDCRNSLKPIDVQDSIISKFEEYTFFSTIYAFLKPLWKGGKKQQREKSEGNDIYNKYIKPSKNCDINELELLFYSFNDFPEFKNEATKHIYGNKGIPLIYILYHFYTLIFSIGGLESEIKELFEDFRLFILLVIISSSTLTKPGLGKKRRWPNEEQYKDVQKTVEAILFNFLYFFYNKIKDNNNKIEDYNDNLDENEQKYVNYLRQINDLLLENFGYFLKILNKIYKEIKKEEEKKTNANFFGKSFDFIKNIKYIFVEYEDIKKSGGYTLIEKMYKECSILTKDNDKNENYLDNISKLNFFVTEKKDKDEKDEKEKKEEKAKIINEFIKDEEIGEFFNKHKEDYKEKLFPFICYVAARKDLIKNIIPSYDNRPNISFYTDELCLIPDYIPNCSFDSTLKKNIESIHKNLIFVLQLAEKTIQIEEHLKSHNYMKDKMKLFSFTGIWSNKEYFYDKKYKLKYRLLNHLTDDLTRIFLTPIIDVDYYLPQFGKFETKNLFRNIKLKPIYKVADFSFNIQDTKRMLCDPPKKKATSKKNIQEVQPPPIEEKEKININKELNKKEEDNSDKNALFFLGQENFKFLPNINRISIGNEEKKEVDEIHTHLFLDFVNKKHNVQQENCIYTNACLVKIGFHIRGIIYNNQEEIGFYSYETKRSDDDEDYDSDRKVCFGSIFRTQTKKYTYYYLKIPLNKIKFVLKRRYYFKRSGIEIFTEDNKSYFFNMDETKLRYFIENIKHYMKIETDDITIEYSKFEEKIGFFNKKNLISFIKNKHLIDKKGSSLKILYEKWMKWEMSTLRLIMLMNIFANRSYNDINQYPVFPWIITDYKSKELPDIKKQNFIRPFKPMGMLEISKDAIERKNNYIEHWTSNENDPDREDNYDRYGSHYSTSLYLTYYLVRTFPFSYIRIELQGKNFDDPNRLFNSLPNSFDCVTSQKSDLRELIPEFFCFPEMFYNMNDLNLGEVMDTNKNPKLVQDVDMPLWANNNAYNFVEKHRELLESKEVSNEITEWFNIIFGYKQKGKEAKKIGNYFIKQTYEDFEEIHKKATKNEKIYQCRMVEFGVTPNQLFKSDVYKRQSPNEISKIKRSLLYNILKKIKEKSAFTGNEFDLFELKTSIDEKCFQLFSVINKHKERKKVRFYLLCKDKIKIYSKMEYLFKDPNSEKIKNKDSENFEEEIEKILTEHENNNDDKSDDNSEDNISNTYIFLTETEEKSDRKESNSYSKETTINKDQSKINIRFKTDIKFFAPKYKMNNNETPIIIYNCGIYVAMGGFWTGDIILNRIEEVANDTKKVKTKKSSLIHTGEYSPIVKMILDRYETFIYCCNLLGTVFIYRIDEIDKGIWILYKKISEIQGEISCLTINESLNILMICYKIGYCMIYTLPNCQLFNSFKINKNDLTQLVNIKQSTNSNFIIYPEIAIISQSSLPCYVFYIKSKNILCVYSVNAKCLKDIVIDYEIVANGIKKYTDYAFKDHLFIYNSRKNVIDVHRLTDLNIIVSSPIINYNFIDFNFGFDLDHLVILASSKNKNEKNPYKMLVLKGSGIDIDWK